MTHWLFTSTFGSGHVNPLVPLVRACAARGDRATFALPPEPAARVRGLGIEAVDVGLDRHAPAVDELTRGMVVHGSHRSSMAKMFAATLAPGMVEPLRAVCDELRPDVIVSEMLEFAGPLVARERGLPAALFCFGIPDPTPMLRQIAQPQLDDFYATEGQEAGADYLLTLPRLVGAPARFGEAASGALGGERGEAGRLLHIRQEPVSVDRASESDAVRWLANQPAPRAYVTFGTALATVRDGLFEPILEALEALSMHALVTTGPLRDPSSLQSSERVRIERFVPQVAVLEHVELIIAHAGFGTTTGGLGAGVPMLLVPVGADQPFNAAAARALGVARVIEREALDVSAVRTAIEGMLAGSEPAKAREVQTKLGDMPGPAEALAWLAETLGEPN